MKTTHCVEDSPRIFWISSILFDFIINITCIYAFLRPIYLAARSIENVSHAHVTINGSNIFLTGQNGSESPWTFAFIVVRLKKNSTQILVNVSLAGELSHFQFLS